MINNAKIAMVVNYVPKASQKIANELNTHNILLKNPDYDAKYIKKWLEEFDKSLNEKFLKIFQRIVKEIR